MSARRNGIRQRGSGLLGVTALAAGILAMGPACAENGGAGMKEQAVRDAFAAQLAAMTAGDTRALGAMLDEHFVLTHLTGYRQPKAEWLAQMREGRFIYHSMTSTRVSVEWDNARLRLTGDTQTDSTVSGMRRPGGWRLRMTQDYERRDGHWIALNCETSIW